MRLSVLSASHVRDVVWCALCLFVLVCDRAIALLRACVRWFDVLCDIVCAFVHDNGLCVVRFVCALLCGVV